jgi:multiple sugar transport system permease protein
MVTDVLARLTLLALSVFALLPIVWMFLMSLKKQVDALASPPKWLFVPTLDNYRTVLLQSDFPHAFMNSVIVSLTSIAIGLLVGVPAAYVLARYQFRGKHDIGFWILSTRMGPPVIVLLPFYLMFRSVGLLDSVVALIIMHVALNLALIIWLIRGFFLDVPRELEDASLVDGCSRLGALTRVALPLVAPGIAATAIIAFIFSWNELLFAIVLTQRTATTAPVAVFSYITYQGIEWGPLTAAGMIVVIPVVIFALIAQRHIIRGLTFGAVK